VEPWISGTFELTSIRQHVPPDETTHALSCCDRLHRHLWRSRRGSANPGRAQSADLVLCTGWLPTRRSGQPADVKGTPDVAPPICHRDQNCRIAAGIVATGAVSARPRLRRNRQLPENRAWRKAADKGSTSAMVETRRALRTGSAWPATTQARKRSSVLRKPHRAASQSAALFRWGGAPADPARARAALGEAARPMPKPSNQLGLMMETVPASGGRCRRAALLKRRPANQPRRAGADGRVRPKRARPVEGFGRRESLLRKIRGVGNQDAKKAR